MDKLRCGSKIYKGIEVPLNAKIFLSKSGRECYVSGITDNIAKVKYIDTGEIKDVSLELINKYL